MDENLQRRLARQLANGEAILFTGAGFSLGCTSKAGLALPTGDGIRRALWPIAFPTEPIDDYSSLPDVYRAAQQAGGNAVKRALDEHFRVDAGEIPLPYGIWFSMPWRRIYTLNIDDLDERVGEVFKLPRRIRSLSGIRDHVPSDSPDLQSVHINGRVADYPDVVFSQQDFARQAIAADPWYAFLAAELLGNPVVFVGTVLNEPALWQHIELRRRGGDRRADQRPGSYLVSPGLDPARRRLLGELNVAHVQMSAADFATDILQFMAKDAERGHERIAVLRRPEAHRQSPLRYVAELRRSRVEDLASFLLGREPDWHDLTEGFAVERVFEEGIFGTFANSDARVLMLSGTAGSGKSASLMRLALAAHASGLRTAWLEREAGMSLTGLREAVASSDAEVVVIDDLERFGSAGIDLLTGVVAKNAELRILAAMRGTRFESYRTIERFADADASLMHTVVPNLEDRDIDLLLGSLDRAKRLGRLRGMSPGRRRVEFQRRCGRQLLVAMIETTSGEGFKEKIRRECRELEPPLSFVYPVVALASSQGVGVTQEEAIIAAGGATDDALHGLRRLQAQHLIIRRDDMFFARHKVVADESVAGYRAEGQIREPLTGLLLALAMKWSPELPRNHRVNRLLTRMLNHRFMSRITDSAETPRIAYAAVEAHLGENHHYWLQRGNYELDEQSLDLAHNYLEQARAMAPDDAYVQVSWAHKALRVAAANPSLPGAQESAEEALTELRDVIARNGDRNYAPFHVLGSQGLHWYRRAIVSHRDRVDGLAELLRIVRAGRRLHPHEEDLRVLESDLERAYLELGLQ